MNKNIISIVQMFPDFEAKIDFMFQTDENFRDLCLDHIVCATMIIERKKNLNKYTAEIEEYEDVQRNLEQEIFRMIVK